ncbi:protein-export membrane protein SecD [Clostridium sp. DL-VIII]|uniref:protein translocase subunit SecD n=1 Tax=Clostridium sp. DL-VIII TaxID=641107 RepID=UPI00023AF931|nr:protein translocase subunit SecD [Clostridium sp. DL-VIII]EHI99311.1 protein-export membrane protein SecD [Clostridium sp. DL-VIII]
MKKKGKSSAILIAIIVVIGLLAFAGFKGFVLGGWEFKSFNKVITRGLDLQGGVSVLMEIQKDSVTSEELESAKEHIALRVNKLGVAETIVTTEGQKRIRVDIPGMTNSKEIVDSLSQSGNLSFKAPDGTEVLTGKDVKKATAQMNQQTGQYEVGLQLSDEGAQKFADATGKYIGQKITIYLDDEQISDPTVDQQITGGNASINIHGTLEQNKELAGMINAGALPLPVKEVTVSNVGAELGATAFPNSIKAGIIGVALVFLFMLIRYRRQGLMADIALTLYIVLALFAFVEIGVTLTLPGIAAFLMTIGVAVDANILTFERTKEELKKGYSIKAAAKKGAENALSSIVDSNVTTLLAALILYSIGSGTVKGFAITLMIGIVISLFTGLVITKLLVNLGVQSGFINKASHFGVKLEKGDEKHA